LVINILVIPVDKWYWSNDPRYQYQHDTNIWLLHYTPIRNLFLLIQFPNTGNIENQKNTVKHCQGNCYYCTSVMKLSFKFTTVHGIHLYL